MSIKKSWLFLLIIFSCAGLFSASFIMAMPSEADSNTWQMKSPQTAFALGFGASGDFLGRDLEDGVEVEDSDWQGANIYFDPAEKVHLDVFLGVTKAQLQNLPLSLSNGAATTVLGKGETKTAFGFGIGAKVDIVEFAVVPDQPKMELFASGGYRVANLDLDADTVLGSNGLRPTTVDVGVTVQEWQVGAGIKQRFDNVFPGVGLIPNIGVKYSDVDVNISGTSSFVAGPGVTASLLTGSRHSEDNVGTFLGLQILGWEERLSLTVEGRFIDESALYLNSHIRW